MFERITKDTFDMVYSILEEVFPVEELREKEGQKALLDKEQYRLYGIKTDCGIIQGVVALWDFCGFLYIEHLAIAVAFRNEGVGGNMLEAMINRAAKAIVLEVEVPENDLQKRRVGFYERHGFFCNMYPYLQPPLRKGLDMLPLRLMTYPEPISEDIYKKYKEILYKNVFDCEEV
ncbi:MAG: GNAT family N-acetyltransferase [Anaerotignum sp.]